MIWAARLSWPAAAMMAAAVMALAATNDWSARTTYIVLVLTLVAFVAIAVPTIEVGLDRRRRPAAADHGSKADARR